MVAVRGKSEVRAFIGGLPAKLPNLLRGAARAGANVIADEIKERTTSEEVRDGIRIRTQAGDGEIRVKIDVKPGWARSLGTWLEYGTSAHFISVDESQRNGRSVGRINQQATEQGASLVIGGNFVGKTVFHPGARPFPVFRPALDTKEAEAIRAAQSYINARVKPSGIAAGSEGDAE